MNRLKKAIKELRTHLGRDSRGCDLLDEVQRIANEQRKELALHSESRQALELLVESKQEERIKAEAEAERLSRCNEHLESRVRALESSNSILRSKQSQSQSPGDQPLKGSGMEPAVVMSIFDKLKAELGKSPKPIAVHPIVNQRVSQSKSGIEARISDIISDLIKLNPSKSELRGENIYEARISDIVSDFSVSSQLTLGRFVICTSAIGWDYVLSGSMDISSFPENFRIRLFRWLKKSIDLSWSRNDSLDGRVR